MQGDRTIVAKRTQCVNFGVGGNHIAPSSRSADAAIKTWSHFRSPQLAAYEVQNGNHIETFQDTFAQLELIEPYAQRAFDLLVGQVGIVVRGPIIAELAAYNARKRARWD